MGVYDSYELPNGEWVQIKVGYPCYDGYKIGDAVPIPNGAYVGYEGVIVVENGVYTRGFESAEEAKLAGINSFMDKWGGAVEDNEDVYDHLLRSNPVGTAINEVIFETWVDRSGVDDDGKPKPLVLKWFAVDHLRLMLYAALSATPHAALRLNSIDGEPLTMAKVEQSIEDKTGLTLYFRPVTHEVMERIKERNDG